MPQLPNPYGRRPVPDARAGIATVRNAGTVGSAVAGLGRAVQYAGDVVGRAYEQVKNEEETAKAADADTAASQWFRDRLYDPEHGYLSTSEHNAVAGREQVAKDIETYQAEALKGLDPGVAARLKPMLAARAEAALQKVDIHAANERGKWLESAADGAIYAAQNDALAAYGSPKDIDAAIENGVVAIEQRGKRLGWSPEETAMERQKFVSGTLKGVVARQATTDPAAAMAYARRQGNAGRISSADMLDIEQSVGTAARQSDGEALGAGLWAARESVFSAIATGDSKRIADALMPAVNYQESGGRTGLTSPKGAMGVSQMMPDTARAAAARLGVPYDEEKLLKDADYATKLGAEEMRRLIEKYDGNVQLALAAYNAGDGKVDEWLKKYGDPRAGGITTSDFLAQIPYQETRNYVDAVTARVGLGHVEDIPDPVARGAAARRFDALATRDEAAQKRFLAGFDDELASIRYGNPPPQESRFTRTELITRLGPVRGQEAWDEKQQAIRDGELFATVRTASPAEVASARKRLEAETETPAGFKSATERLATFDRIVSARNQAIVADPAGYAASVNSDLGDMLSADPQQFDPLAWASAQEATQQRLGVRDIRILTKSQAKAMVAQLDAAPAAEVGDRIAGLEQQWGQYFPDVRAELGEAGLPAGAYVASMYTDDPALMMEIVQATRTGDKALSEGLDQGYVADLRLGIAGELQRYRQAFEAGAAPGANTAEFNKLNSAIEQWAIAQYRSGREITAADAVERFMDGKWLDPDRMGSVRALVPARLPGGQWLSERMVEVATDAAQTTDKLREFKPETIGPEGAPLAEGGMSQGEMRTLSAAVRSGVWIMNGAQDGLMLAVPALVQRPDGLVQTNELVPIRNAKGQPYQVRFADIPGIITKMGGLPGRIDTHAGAWSLVPG